MKKLRYLLPICVLLLFPSTALANAGTPLIWASILHLVLGNAIIGLMEGLLLAWLFKCPKLKSILFLIAANYASAWVGGFLISGYLVSLVDITIQDFRKWFFFFVVVAFFVTLVIEFAFFWYALSPREHRLRRALRAALIINGMSYVLLCGWYWVASGTSVLTELEVVKADEMKLPEPYVLYYLSSAGDEVVRMNLNEPDTKHAFFKVRAHHRNDRLFARPRSDSGFDLFVHLDSEQQGAKAYVMVLENFSEQAPLDRSIAQGYSDNVRGSWFNFGQVPAIGTDSDWKFSTGFWAADGIRGVNKKTKKTVHYSLELPFFAWIFRNATQISGGYVVVQLGDDQICLLHAESGKIALVARGKGPIVAKPKTSNKIR